MEYQQNSWYNPSVIKRIQQRINIVLIIIGVLMLYMNYSWMVQLIKNFIKNI